MKCHASSITSAGPRARAEFSGSRLSGDRSGPHERALAHGFGKTAVRCGDDMDVDRHGPRTGMRSLSRSATSRRMSIATSTIRRSAPASERGTFRGRLGAVGLGDGRAFVCGKFGGGRELAVQRPDIRRRTHVGLPTWLCCAPPMFPALHPPRVVAKLRNRGYWARFAQCMVLIRLMPVAVRQDGGRERLRVQGHVRKGRRESWRRARSVRVNAHGAQRHRSGGCGEVRASAFYARDQGRDQARYCWMRVVRKPASPWRSMEYCQDRNSSTVSV